MRQFNNLYKAQNKPSLNLTWSVGDPPLTDIGELSAAIGNFDGVHLGHQSLIEAVLADGRRPAVITFTPHPRRFFKPDSDGFTLADAYDKQVLLGALGVDVVINLDFNEALRQTTAEDFVNIVLPSLGIKALYAGKDFTFGLNRQGNLDLVKNLGQAHGITANGVEICCHDGETISSSRIRECLAGGDVQGAWALLGRPYAVSNLVLEGAKRGRSIGFPTANLSLGELQQPAHGVYAIEVQLEDGSHHSGVANIGRRPTVSGEGVLLEAHLFDYVGDLYGTRLNVFLLDFIRPEQKFSGLDALKLQIEKDVTQAKQKYNDSMALEGCRM